MSKHPTAILFELNEVPLAVLRDYAKSRPQSAIADFILLGNAYETICPDTIALDPWISWPTLHRGVPDTTHGVLHLGQTSQSDSSYPTIWKRLKDAGIPTGVFGSLHSSSESPSEFEDYRFFVPDYFTTNDNAFPSFMKGFHGLNVRLTRASARNVSRSIPLLETARAIASFLALGMSGSTATTIFGQLQDERTTPWTKVRRRNIQSLIMGDLFVRLFRRKRPQFATFYTNNVAAAMHRFWSATYPASFENNMDAEWLDRYSDEIFVALDKVDEILMKLRTLLEDGDQILLASSMGQGPIPFERTDGYYVMTDINRFMSTIGLAQDAWQESPAMVPCRSVTFRDATSLSKFTQALAKVEINGTPFVESDEPIGPASYSVDSEQLFAHIFVHIEGAEAPSVSIGRSSTSHETLGLDFLAYEDGVNNTAQHVPQGSLIVYPGVPSHGRSVRQISTLDIVPSILAFFGVAGENDLPGTNSVPLDASQQIDLRAASTERFVDLPTATAISTKDVS